MVDSYFEYDFNYNAEQNIWSGVRESLHYNESKSIGEIIFEELRRHPQNICQICDTEKTVLTKEQMLVNAIRIATFLQTNGILQDDIVASTARNSTHMAAIAYGCFFNGTAIHTLNPNYEEQTYRELLHITKPKIVFCDAQDYEKVQRATAQLHTTIYVMQAAHNGKVPSILDILQTAYDKRFRPTKLTKGKNQTLAILCSSGTTGTPKAVTISNSHRVFSTFGSLRADDVQYSPSTLDWLSGLVTFVSTAVYGSRRIISENPFEPSDFLRMLTEYQITWVVLTPAHISMLFKCRELSAEKLKSLRNFWYGGSGCPVETQRKLKSYLPNCCCQFAYGCTELGHLLTAHIVGSKKLGSVGRPVPGVRMKIIDENGLCLGINQVGEICCDNNQYWAGYYDNAKASGEMKDDAGWLHMGDLGYFDGEGYLYVVDRKKDMLKYMNIMYYPNEVEEVIAKMPDVLAVCVFGVFDECVGDAAAAAIVCRDGSNLTEEDVIDFVKRNVGAKYKELNGGAFLVKELQKSPNGKLNRKAVKEQCLARKAI